MEEVGSQHQGMDRPGVRQVPDGSGEQGKMEKTGCKIICGAPTTFAVKELMMMMKIAGLILSIVTPSQPLRSYQSADAIVVLVEIIQNQTHEMLNGRLFNPQYNAFCLVSSG